MTIKKSFILLIHAFVGWALCGAIMAVGPQFMSMETTLIVHAVGAPIIFALVSLSYFGRYHFTAPLQTAMIFTAFVILADFFLVALLINRSLEMFASFIGTWLPFVLIFSSTYITGLVITRRSERPIVA